MFRYSDTLSNRYCGCDDFVTKHDRKLARNVEFVEFALQSSSIERLRLGL